MQVLILLSVCAAVMVWGLDVSGYANPYYSAAAQAGSESWKAMFFGSLDGSNAITVDKPPLALWPMAMSVRLFGMSSWSILLPQAVEGVASVGVLYACVRRTTGVVWAGLLAGAIFALTPVSVLVFRYNNPDAMLALLLLGAAYATLRALDDRHPAAWLILAGTLVGLGFLTKMLEAFIVQPALALTYLVFGLGTPLRRVARVAQAGTATVAAAAWWVAAVELWPATARPYIGGSPTNSVLELALGYNGIGRLTGSTGTTAASGGLGATNLARIGRTDLGAEIAWFVPATLVLGIVAWLLSRRQVQVRRVRAALTLWTVWLVVAALVFGLMAGIFHSYYTVILAPALAALISIGAWLLWPLRATVWARSTLSWTVLATTLLSAGTVLALGGHQRWTAVPVLVVGAASALALHPRTGPPRLRAAVGVLAVAASVSGPLVFDLATIRQPHVGSSPLVGPGRGSVSPALVGGVSIAPQGVFFASLYAPLTSELVATLTADSEQYRWAAATLGARSASAYQLAIDEPVMAIGGYKGQDPTPTLGQFQSLVDAGQIHWLVAGGTSGATGNAIEDWVAARFPSTVVDRWVLYDLSSTTRTLAVSSRAAPVSMTAISDALPLRECSHVGGRFADLRCAAW